MKKRLIYSLLLPLFLTANVFAQNVTGTWKRTAMLLTEANGKTEDSMAALTEAMPCTAGITYTFLAGGAMRVDVPETCGSMKKTIENMNKAGRWSARSNKIEIVVPDKSLPDSSYDLTVSGNTMTWTFDYAANPQMPNPTKAKRLVIKYVRV